MKNNIIIALLLSIIVLSAGCKRKTTSSEFEDKLLPKAFVMSGTYTDMDSMLFSKFNTATDISSLKQILPSSETQIISAVFLAGGSIDAIPQTAMESIFEYYINGGTIVVMDPISRDWLFLWRRMLECRNNYTGTVSEQADSDLENWRAELVETEDFSGRESIFDNKIGCVIGVRLYDYYSQTDTLNIANIADWLTGTPTQDIVTSEYEASIVKHTSN